MFNDFCQIGALLTDRNRCLYHLEALSFELEREVDRQIQSHDVASHRADPRVRLTPGDAAKLKAQVVSKDTVGKPNVGGSTFRCVSDAEIPDGPARAKLRFDDI